MTRKYFSVERLLYRMGGSEITERSTKIYRTYSLICFSIFIVPYPFIASVDLFTQSFTDALSSWFIVVGALVGQIFSLTSYINRRKIARLLNKLEEEPFLPNFERGGDQENKLIQKWHKFNYFQGLVFLVAVCFSILSQLIYTFIKRLSSSNYEDWSMGYAGFTVLNTTYSPNYEFAWIYETSSLFLLCFNGCATSLMVSSVLAHLGIQFRMLQNNLRRLILNAHQKMVKERPHVTFANLEKTPWRYLQRSIKETVEYHLNIIEFSKEFEEIFSLTILSLYLLTLMMVCVDVYRATLLPSNDIGTLRVFLESLTASFHAFLICNSGDEMTYQSAKVASAVYDVDFVGTDLRFQKSLIIVMRKGQDNVKIKAGKLINTSLMTYVWIWRTAYSAYMMLRSVNVKN